MTQEEQRKPDPAPSSWRHRFLASYFWLILKNVIGWLLILVALVAGPLVPGPGGIPLFLIGFALVSFPGKRRLTARVLRGKPVQMRRAPLLLACACLAIVIPALVLLMWPSRLSDARSGPFARDPAWAVSLYLAAAVVVWALARLTPRALNLLLRATARARRAFRPWLRRHHVRLLPPRWRVRRLHEAGSGPFRLKDEILGFSKKHWRRH